MRFETQQDLEREHEVMTQFSKGNKFEKLGDHDLDFVIPGRCYAEIKCLNSSSSTYKYSILSLIKLVKMQERSRELPTFIIFKYTDKIKYINFNDIEGNVRQSGRVEREGSTNDRELLLFLDRAKLTEL